MQTSLPMALYKNFLGHAPDWYKKTIVAFLIANPFLFMADPYVAGWVLVVQFIFTLAMALKCYPLQPGGLLLIEAMFIGMTSPDHMMHEIEVNLEVLLLLVFMVAGIHFMKDLLLFLFTKLVIRVKNKLVLSLSFIIASAFLSAFLDALTVVAVIIAVGLGFYTIYHKVASGKEFHHDHDHTDDGNVELGSNDLEDFRAFLRNLMMHSAVGTALGGVMTMVGEPQNLIIADKASWGFGEFFVRMSPITVPVFICGLLTTVLLEKGKLFSYGAKLPAAVRDILVSYDKHMDQGRTNRDKARLAVQALIGVWLVVGLAGHFASVGLIGLSVIVLATSASGIIEEQALGKAFEEAQGEYYVQDQETGDVLYFTPRFAGKTATLIVTDEGRVYVDMSELEQQASLISQFGGNLGQAMADAFASKLSGTQPSSVKKPSSVKDDADLNS